VKKCAPGGVLHTMAIQEGDGGVSQVEERRQPVMEDSSEKGHIYHITRSTLIFYLLCVAHNQHWGGSTIIHHYPAL